MELHVVFGKHEVVCEFSGDPKLATLHSTVRHALDGVLSGQAASRFGLKLLPDGVMLSDDDGVAGLSAGSALEVVADGRDILAMHGINHRNLNYELRNAAIRGNCEKVRLILASGLLQELEPYGFEAAVQNNQSAVCSILLSDARIVEVMKRRLADLNFRLFESLLRQPSVVEMLLEHGIADFHPDFFRIAARGSHDWVFPMVVPHVPDPVLQLDGSLWEAVKAGGQSTVRAVVAAHSNPADLASALSHAVYYWRQDLSPMCRLLMELGAAVPSQADLHKATCLGFFDVLVQHGADLDQEGSTPRRGKSVRFAIDIANPTPFLATEDVAKQELLINLGANVNARDSEGWTVLMLDPQVHIMRLAIARGADTNAVDNTGHTCLMHACSRGGLAQTELLLDHGAGLEATDFEGTTALWYAGASVTSPELLPLLLGRGACVNVHDSEGEWFLHYMHRCVDASRLWELVGSTPHLDVNVADSSTGHTLLMKVAAEPSLSTGVGSLLGHPLIDVSVQDDEGWSCLLHAVSAKRLPACQKLLEHAKANDITQECVSAKDNDGRTCLMHAVSDTGYGAFSSPEEAHQACAELVALLISHGADHAPHSTEGLTALHTAVMADNEPAFDALLLAGACPNTRGAKVPLLHLAVTRKRRFMFEKLMAHADIDTSVRDSAGRTLLMRVARSNGSWCQDLLQHEGLDMAAQDDEGWTCLSHAAASGNARVVKLLLEHGGVDVNIGAVPPLTAAVLAASEPACRVLLEHGADPTTPAADGVLCLDVAEGLRCRGGKVVLQVIQDSLASGSQKADAAGVAQPEAHSPAGSSAKRKRDSQSSDEAPSHTCAVCGAAALASGEPFPSEESVLRHASSKHRMRRSEYTRRFGG